jgi:hypothetical protein
MAGVVVINRTNSLRALTIEQSFWVARPKQSEYYVVLGSRKKAVPPAAEIAQFVNSKTKHHHSESLSAVSGPSLLGIALTKVWPAMREGGSCAQTA